MKRYISVKEASDLLGLSTNTVYKYLNDGLIFGKRVGRGRFKIPKSEIFPLLKEKESEIKKTFEKPQDISEVSSNFVYTAYIFIFAALITGVYLFWYISDSGLRLPEEFIRGRNYLGIAWFGITTPVFLFSLNKRKSKAIDITLITASIISLLYAALLSATQGITNSFFAFFCSLALAVLVFWRNEKIAILKSRKGIVFSSSIWLAGILCLVVISSMIDVSNDIQHQYISKKDIVEVEPINDTLGVTSENIKTIVLTPDYPSAEVSSYFGLGADKDTSGILSLVTEKEDYEKRFYEWVSEERTSNHSTIKVPIKLPDNFYDWVDNNCLTIEIDTDSNRYDDNDIDIFLVLEDGRKLASVMDQTSVRPGEWRKISFNKEDFSNGKLINWNKKEQVATFYLRLGTKQGRAVRVGEITLSYKERI